MIAPPRIGLYLTLLLSAAVASCARTAPPAPVVVGGQPSGVPSTPAASVAPSPSARLGGAGVPLPAVTYPEQMTVQPGETLYGIAQRHDVPVRSLIETNGLTPPYQLTTGRVLALPQTRRHVVQAGETLYSVSRIYGVDASTLARTNEIAPPYVIRIGQSLVLPAPVQPAEAQAAPTVASREPPVPSLASPPAAPSTQISSAATTPRIEDPKLPPPEAAPPNSLQETAALPKPAPRNGSRSFLWPVRGRVVTAYGPGEGGAHNDGINIAAPQGTTVVAADAGVVAYAGNELRGYGNLVLIKHADGWMTAYAHNSTLLVKRGEKVKRGQAIARVGATGAVGEPQVHFEIRHGEKALDPSDYMPTPSAAATSG